MKLKVVAKPCDFVVCPTVYEAENGDFIVQGYVLDEEYRQEMQISDGEDAVRVPADLVEALHEYLRNR